MVNTSSGAYEMVFFNISCLFLVVFLNLIVIRIYIII